MYRLVIIEDEKLVIKSLRASLDWQTQGFQIVGEATNGLDGLTLLEDVKPDLALVDVRMPGINGLELISLARQANLATLFIIISGYAEFAYVQKALNNGAIGYCLKPFSEREISEGLQKARQILDERISRLRLELLVLLSEQTAGQAGRLRAILQSAGLSPEQPLAAIVIMAKEAMQADISLRKGMTCSLGRNKTLLLIPWQDVTFCLSHQINPGQQVDGIGIGQPVKAAEQLREAVEQAVIAALHYFMTGQVGITTEYGKLQLDEGDRLMKAFDKSTEPKACLPLLKTAGTCLDRGQLAIHHLLYLYNHVVHVIRPFNIGQLEGYLSGPEQLVDLYQDARAVLSALQQVLEQADLPFVQPTETIRNETARQMIDYVSQNYLSDISVSKISGMFTINPSYISQLFKKELGETFTEYVTRLRTQHACRLLRTTSLTVSEISEKTGYGDYFYFTRVFKKTMGMTPSQYRSSRQPEPHEYAADPPMENR
jgi:two-component system response regulator YesN